MDGRPVLPYAMAAYAPATFAPYQSPEAASSSSSSSGNSGGSGSSTPHDLSPSRPNSVPMHHQYQHYQPALSLPLYPHYQSLMPPQLSHQATVVPLHSQAYHVAPTPFITQQQHQQEQQQQQQQYLQHHDQQQQQQYLQQQHHHQLQQQYLQQQQQHHHHHQLLQQQQQQQQQYLQYQQPYMVSQASYQPPLPSHHGPSIASPTLSATSIPVETDQYLTTNVINNSVQYTPTNQDTNNDEDGDGNQSPSTSPPGSPKGKARRLPVACLNCRKSKVACSKVRPCQRCVRKGIEHLCVDIPRKQRASRHIAVLRDANPKHHQQQQQQQQQQTEPPLHVPSIKQAYDAIYRSNSGKVELVSPISHSKFEVPDASRASPTVQSGNLLPMGPVSPPSGAQPFSSSLSPVATTGAVATIESPTNTTASPYAETQRLSSPPLYLPQAQPPFQSHQVYNSDGSDSQCVPPPIFEQQTPAQSQSSQPSTYHSTPQQQQQQQLYAPFAYSHGSPYYSQSQLLLYTSNQHQVICTYTTPSQPSTVQQQQQQQQQPAIFHKPESPTASQAPLVSIHDSAQFKWYLNTDEPSSKRLACGDQVCCAETSTIQHHTERIASMWLLEQFEQLRNCSLPTHPLTHCSAVIVVV
jgi:hypothetical protein